MAAKSPTYPNFSLRQAISRAGKIFKEDRRNPIDRAVAVRHIGYTGPSGAADKALGTLAQFGLVERVGKGELRISQLTVDILHAETERDRKAALAQAAFSPPLFKALKERFPDGVSADALRSYLVRENFLDRAINPIISSFTDTCAFLKQEGAFESGGQSGSDDSESTAFEDEDADMDIAEEIREAPSAPRPRTTAQAASSAPGVGPLSILQMQHLPGPGMQQAAFPLAEGTVFLTFPEQMTADGYAELQEYLAIFLRRAARTKRLQEERDDFSDIA